MEDLKLVVHAGPHRRLNCPVSAVIKAPLSFSSGRLKRLGREVPCQVDRKGMELHVGWILDDLAADEVAKYDLSLGREIVQDGVELFKGESEIKVSVGGSHFTTYRYGAELARPHLYPVIGPYGDGVTRRLLQEGEGDHSHHRSIWVSHGEVNGFDNWSEGPSHTRTVHKKFGALESGPVFGRILALSAWVGPEGWISQHKTAAILSERAEWTFYNTCRKVRIIDLHLKLTACNMDVLFGDTKEGGLASLRVEESMEVRLGQGGKIQNGIGGINEEETWGKRAPWCDYSGPVNGKQVGVTIMDHPDSFRHPTYWHVRNYGLMTANPFGLSHFYGDKTRRGCHLLSPGESLVGIFRYYIHPGDATEANVGQRYHDFSNPPKVEVR